MAQMLPPLREDLQLKQSEMDRFGRLSWVIHDPARNRFFSLDWLSSELLKRWRLRESEQVLNAVNTETTLEVDEQDLQDLTRFLDQNELLQVYAPESTDRLQARASSTRQGLLTTLLKRYLYLRIPLVNPEPLLKLLLPLVKPLGQSWFFKLTLVALCFGLYQLGRRWDSFTHSFGQSFNLETLIQIALVVVFVKVLHEFGHAFAAYSRGCRVPRMGLVFLVMFPVAYTDVTDSWKLPPNERMSIGLAGIKVELMIAAWATVIWGLLPPGGMRDGLFLILTVTWLGTLIINASPFMRFDGYFVLMDYWRLPNLHQRAGALGRWWLRKALLGDQTPAPEYLAGDQKRLLIFAYMTWLYRFVVLSGIAWLVYELFPQPFGLMLAAIELYWFILLPIWREIRQWPVLIVSSFKRPQLWVSLGFLIFLGVSLFYPWRQSFTIQAVMMPERELTVETGVAARLIEIPTDERWIEKGELIARFENPTLNYELAKVDLQLEKLQWMLNQQSFMSELRSSGAQLQAQLIELNDQRQSLETLVQLLSVRAPLSGFFVPEESLPSIGSWVPTGELLGSLYSSKHQVAGYLTSQQRYWLRPDTPLVWQSDTAFVELEKLRLANQSAEIIEFPLLLRSAGGELAARRTAEGWVPDESIYSFTARVTGSNEQGYAQIAGEIEMQTRAHSLWTLFAESVRQQVQQDFGFNL